MKIKKILEIIIGMIIYESIVNDVLKERPKI